MLEEPEADPALAVLDQAVIDAVGARLAAGRRAGPDAEAIALRGLFEPGLDRRAVAVLRAVLGRIEATGPARWVACGAAAQILAADRHGAAVRPIAELDEALAVVRTGGRALIDVATPRAWWGRLLAMPDLRVVGALPDDAHGRPAALVLALGSSGPSGDDRTFWVTDSPASDVRIVEALGRAGLAADPLAATGGLKLFMLAGYVQAQDPRLAQAPGSLSGVIGAAPIF